MKFVIVLACLVAVAFAGDVEIVRSDSDVQPDGYKFDFATSDGTSHQAEGHATNVGSENEGISVKGSYSWVDETGHTHTVNYIADENGFQPQGEDLPVGPVDSH
ncbi:hypothetical protein ACFFRR_011794 [Megaselia abdita]